MIVIVIIAGFVTGAIIALAIVFLAYFKFMILAYKSLCEIDWAEEIYSFTHNISLSESDTTTQGNYKYFEKLILKTIEMKLLHWRKNV